MAGEGGTHVAVEIKGAVDVLWGPKHKVLPSKGFPKKEEKFYPEITRC